MRKLAALLRNLFHHRRINSDLTEEVGTAFDLLVKEKQRTGLDPASAHRAARIEFGGIEPVVEAIHDVKAGAWISAWTLDLRHAFRLLGRSPLFSAFAVASLALGIGAAG